MPEKEQYLGLLDIHGLVKIAEGESVEEVTTGLEPTLRQARRSYPNFNWHNSMRIFKVEEIKNG